MPKAGSGFHCSSGLKRSSAARHGGTDPRTHGGGSCVWEWEPRAELPSLGRFPICPLGQAGGSQRALQALMLGWEGVRWRTGAGMAARGPGRTGDLGALCTHA